jgi:tRNA 2-thiouridine synthesizing protein C
VIHTLFIQHRLPYANYQAQETLEALLVMAAFGQTPNVLFQGDGVWQLVGTQQNSAAFGHSSIVAQSGAFELYDINPQNIYVDLYSLQQRQLQPHHLAIQATKIEPQQLAHFINQHQRIIRF